MKLNGKLALVLLGVSSSVAIGYAQLKSYQNTRTGNATVDQQTFQEVYNAIRAEYLYPIEESKLWQGAIAGMLGALNDQFTYYTPPEDNVFAQQELEGKFFGVGATLRPTNPDGTGATIVELHPGFPAQEAGMQIGDKIVKVDDTDISKMPMQQAITKIRGQKGTTVELQVERAGTLLTFKLQRKEIIEYAVQTEILPNNVGYVQVRTFNNRLIFDQMDAALKTLKDKKVDQVVLDLRDNGGGLLCGGIYVSDAFLSKGNIVSLRDRTGKETIPGSPFNSACYGVAKKADTDYTGKMVVLVNRNSASASEIVAGALQDLERATVIGEKTFGKGVAQDVINDLPDGGKLALVANEWLLPSGRNLHNKGITPDIEVKDNRFPNPIIIEGTGAQPGDKLTLTLQGKPLELTADKDGKFSYSEVPQPRARTSNSLVDLEGDDILKRALAELAKK